MFISGFTNEEKAGFVPALFSNISVGLNALIEIAQSKQLPINDTVIFFKTS